MKIHKRNCNRCIWREDCKFRKNVLCVCEDYEPIDDDELRIEQYRNSLKERARAYQEILEEISPEEE